jgi:signal transduction histidine kinase
LALLHQEADALRAELRVLREDLARVKQVVISATPGAQLLEANEQLLLAALRAQAVADAARRRLRDLTGAQPKLPHLAMSGQLARAEYHTRVAELREANEQLVLAALSSRELEADAEQSHNRQIAFLAMAAHELRNPLLPLRLADQGGLGIGLAVVRELVEAYGGTVVATSAGKDLGSEFVVSLPLVMQP